MGDQCLLPKNKKIKMVAPDGGWGYAVCLAVTIDFVALNTFQPCFGMIYKDFMTETRMGTTSLTSLHGITAITTSLSSYFIGAFLKLVSLRKLIVIASITFNIGMFMQIWMTTQLELFISQGVLVGLGIGLMYPLMCTILNDYFVKKRLFAVSLTQTVAAIVAIVTPMFVKWAMETYGFRGMIMLQSAISMHTFLATVLMQPVKWHMKTEECLNNSEDTKTSKLIEKSATTIQTVTESSEEVDYYNSNEIIMNNTDEDTKIERRRLVEKICDMLDLSLFKDVHLMVALFSTSLTTFIEFNYVLILPQSLYVLDWTEANVAWAISLYGFGDLTGRVLLILFNRAASKFSSHSIFIAALLFSVVSRIVMLFVPGLVAKLCFIVLMGIFRSPLVTLPPLVTAECVDQTKFASAVGISLLLIGVITLVFGPIVGIIRDFLNNYTITFLILNGLFFAIVIVWCIETYFYNKNKGNRNKNS